MFKHDRSLLLEQEKSLLLEKERSLLFEQERSFLSEQEIVWRSFGGRPVVVRGSFGDRLAGVGRRPSGSRPTAVGRPSDGRAAARCPR